MLDGDVLPSRVGEEGVDRTGPMWSTGVVERLLVAGPAVVLGVDVLDVRSGFAGAHSRSAVLTGAEAGLGGAGAAGP